MSTCDSVREEVGFAMYLFCPWCRATFGMTHPYDNPDRVTAICVSCCRQIATGELRLEPLLDPPAESVEPRHVLDLLNATGS